MCLVSFSKNPHYSSKRKLDLFDGRPLWAYVNITSRCSHKCPWCYGGFNGNLPDEMRLEEYRTILAKLKDLGILQVSISGGEPTEHPEFRQFVEATATYSFLTHLVTHGGRLAEFAPFLAENGVTQVQVNYQGSELHDSQHGVKGSYAAQREGMKAALAQGLEVTATVTVGQYNLPRIPQIFRELEDAGLDRFRIWESTGRGNPWRKGIEALEIFERCRDAAAELGYTFIQSYDPEFEGDTGVKCPPMSNLYFHLNARGKLRFCPAVLKDADVSDFLHDDVSTIMEKFLANNRRLLAENNGEPWCVARGKVPVHAQHADVLSDGAELGSS